MKIELNINAQELAMEIAKELKKFMNSGVKEDDSILTVDQLAKYLSVSESWIYEQVKSKKIPHIKAGGNLRFRKSAINTWLDSLKIPVVNSLGKETIIKLIERK